MGTSYEFKCSKCGLSGEVSGRKDRGFYVHTQTVFCSDCRTLVDVAMGYCDDPTHPRRAANGDEPNFGKCPGCGGGNIQLWNAGDPCPACGGPVKQGMTTALWD